MRGSLVCCGSAVGATELQVSSCSSFPTSLSTSPMCNGLSTAKLTQYGLTQAFSQSASINCWNPATSATEQAVSINSQSSLGSTFNSGGGFSRHFTRGSGYADFQAAALTTWLSRRSSTTPPTTYYDTSKRAIPDVAMFGSQFPLLIGKQFNEAAGTSLASPLFAGVVGLLNAQTVAAKGATLGWINPLLYRLATSYPSSFTDITIGGNACPNDFNGDSACRTAACTGFAAIQEWDPVTGLGVPNYSAMLTGLNALLQANNVMLASGTGNVSAIGNAARAARPSQAEAVGTALLTLAVAISGIALLCW